MKKKAINDMTREEQIAEVDSLIDRDAETWKKYIRESESGLYDFLSRRNLPIIIRPSQR
jgi:hypothetical protein